MKKEGKDLQGKKHKGIKKSRMVSHGEEKDIET